MIGKEKEMCRIKAIHMGNFGGLLGIRRIGKIPNERTRGLCEVTKGMDEKIEAVLRVCGENGE